MPKVIQKRHNRHPHPKIPHISGITEQNRPTIGDYSLGRNWAKIEPFRARIRIQNVPKVIQKCSYRPLRPQKPHNSRITKQNRPKNGCFSLGRNWAIFGHVLVHIFGSNLPISKIPKDLSPSYCHRAVEKKRMKIG